MTSDQPEPTDNEKRKRTTQEELEELQRIITEGYKDH
jgi:hypothetical protein